MRMNQWNTSLTTQARRRDRHHYYSGTESDEDLVGNPPSVASSWAGLPQEVDQLLEEAEEAEVMLLQGEHIIRLIWTTPHTILLCHLHAG